MWTRGIVTALLLAVVWAMSPPAAPAAEIPSQTQELLRSSDYIYTATQRKNGERSKLAAVWFYYSGGDELFFSTSPDSWKAKRLANGSPLFVRVGEADGPSFIGEAREVSDPALIDQMGEAYNEKYWIAWLGFFRPRSERVTSGKTKAYMVKLRPADS